MNEETEDTKAILAGILIVIAILMVVVSITFFILYYFKFGGFVQYIDSNPNFVINFSDLNITN